MGTPEDRENAKKIRRERAEARRLKEEDRHKRVKQDNDEYYQNSTAWQGPRERNKR